jgi:hypothetical protein
MLLDEYFIICNSDGSVKDSYLKTDGPNNGLPDFVFDVEGSFIIFEMKIGPQVTLEWTPPMGPAQCWQKVVYNLDPLKVMTPEIFKEFEHPFLVELGTIGMII